MSKCGRGETEPHWLHPSSPALAPERPCRRGTGAQRKVGTMPTLPSSASPRLPPASLPFVTPTGRRRPLSCLSSQDAVLRSHSLLATGAPSRPLFHILDGRGSSSKGTCGSSRGSWPLVQRPMIRELIKEQDTDRTCSEPLLAARRWGKHRH